MNQKKNLLVFSGAGLSAPSGVSTFRDRDGLWHQHRIEDVADYTTWKQNFHLVHNFYNQRRRDLQTVLPNPAHDAVARWKNTWPSQVDVFTQNVDLLLEAAGCPDVIHLHGRADRMECTACGHNWHVGLEPWDSSSGRCPQCHSLRGVKPGVVFFHQNAPYYRELYRSIRAITSDTMVVVIGTSGFVLDVNNLFGHTAAKKVLNNLESSPAIDELLFDHVFFQSAELAALEINQLVIHHLASESPIT